MEHDESVERTEASTIARLSRLPHIRQRRISGEPVCNEGDPANRLWVVARGMVAVHRYTPSGRRVELRALAADRIFGEVGLLTTGRRTACVVVRGAAELLSFDRRDVLAAMDRDASLALGVAHVAAARVCELSDRVVDAATQRLASRLAILIVEREGPDGSVRLSQQEMADALAVSRESVNRELQALARAGAVRPFRGGLHIVDPRALDSIGRCATG